MSYSKFIARLVTQHRGLVWLAVALMATASIYILVTRLTLDTEVLNLLPGKFASVQGLKIYNNDFAQTRQLTFALVCQPNDVDRLEEFAPSLCRTPPQQPWSTRVLAGSPMETPEGVHDLQGLAVPLLLNLEPQAFAETIAVLQPAKLPVAAQPLASGNRGRLASAGIRTFARPVRRHRARAQTFRRQRRDRRRPAADFARSDDADFSRGHQSTNDQRVRLPGADGKSECVSRAARAQAGKGTDRSRSW